MASMSAADREKMYTEYLQKEGYRPDLEPDGSVGFKKGDETYFIILDEDPQLLFMMLPFWSLDGDKAVEAKALKAALHATARSKVAKVYVVADSVFVTVQLFIDPPQSFPSVIGRCMTALTDARRFYLEALQKG